MITFAVDTSVTTTSVALLEEDNILAELFIHTGRNHAEILLPAIERLLASVGIKKTQIDLLAVTVGPGSFTGLRVGTSTVKGLAFVLKKPVVGVCTLDALALNVAHPDVRTVICPMVDAGRGEVYTALYRSAGPDTCEKTLQECVVRPDEFLGSIHGEVVFLGGGTEKYRNSINDILPDRSSFVPSRFNHVRAGAVGIVGRKRFCNGDISDIMALTPNYLRTSYATEID